MLNLDKLDNPEMCNAVYALEAPTSRDDNRSGLVSVENPTIKNVQWVKPHLSMELYTRRHTHHVWHHHAYPWIELPSLRVRMNESTFF